METYITSELPKALFSSFPELDSSRVSITGHSMGGHGALTLFLKNPGMYKSVSAFAPIANPVNCPWGEKAFKGYLGDDRETWKKHDATELIKGWKGGALDVLIDVVSLPVEIPTREVKALTEEQGTGDNFYKQKQLLPENFAEAAKASGNGQGLTVRYQEVRDLQTLIELKRY
jgi:S-formylglutathione hydrolase